jgi:hypothetical protein
LIFPLDPPRRRGATTGTIGSKITSAIAFSLATLPSPAAAAGFQFNEGSACGLGTAFAAGGSRCAACT